MKKRKFIHIDGANLFHRQANMVNPKLGVDSMIGMAFHLIFTSMKKEYKRWQGDHVVFYLEGKSWRKAVYPEYKLNRAVIHAQKTEREQEDSAILIEAYNDFTDYLINKTNVSVMRCPVAEADDMIYAFIESHPDDEHLLISSDSDFYQLLRFDNVTICDPIKDILLRRDGITDESGNRLSFTIGSNAKIKVGVKDKDFVCEPEWYEYALFMKCIRGDSSDNIFSAYPGVREKCTKTKVGIKGAYADREQKGYSWNNFMLSRWIDHDGKEVVVKEAYDRNCILIDLANIPDTIKAECLQSMVDVLDKPPVKPIDIGMGFMKFTGKWALKKINDNHSEYLDMLKSRYE